MRRTQAATSEVTATELFFDLVFVFVMTQATRVLEEDPTVTGLAHSLLPLVLVCWMYLAFGWLTNAVRPTDVTSRLLLTVAMVGFFVLALDLPVAFERVGWAFPLAYLLVVAIHTGLYLTSSEPVNRRRILRIAPTNAAPAALVAVAPFLPSPWIWVPWVVAVVLVYSTNARGTARGMVIQSEHLVERHGLIILIALGESIVAVGIGASGAAVDLPLAAGATLGIALTAAFWWVYFDGDEDRATAALVATAPERRQDRAFNAFAFGHVVMVAGIVVTAAGIADAIHHFGGHASPWLLGTGAAVFLAGHAVHRWALGSGRVVDRVVGAVVAPPAGLVAAVAGWAGLAVVTAVLAAVAALDRQGSGESSSRGTRPSEGVDV